MDFSFFFRLLTYSRPRLGFFLLFVTTLGESILLFTVVRIGGWSLKTDLLITFQIQLMILCGSQTGISFRGFVGDVCLICHCVRAGNLHFIWLNDIFAVLFSCSAILRGCEIFKWRVRGWESNAWKHGAFCFLTAGRDKVEIWLEHWLKSKTDPTGGVREGWRS